jgi:hypothetical protein
MVVVKVEMWAALRVALTVVRLVATSANTKGRKWAEKSE